MRNLNLNLLRLSIFLIIYNLVTFCNGSNPDTSTIQPIPTLSNAIKSGNIPAKVDLGTIDMLEAHNLYTAEVTLTKLLAAMKKQQELKEHEINIKAALASNLQKLNAINELMQTLVEYTAENLGSMVGELQNTVEMSEDTRTLFFEELNYKVIPVKKLPLAEYSQEELDIFAKFSASGDYQGLDCPLSCAPSVCDNQSNKVTHCFKAKTFKDGSISSECTPFTNTDTLTCPDGFVRCALAQPSRGNVYEVAVASKDRNGTSIAISGRNMHQCLRLLVVPHSVSCSIDNIFSAIQESQRIIVPSGTSIYPSVYGDVVLFKNLQIKKVGDYQLCLLQFHQDPNTKGGSGTRILGSDTIGEINVVDPDSNAVVEHLNYRVNTTMSKDTDNIKSNNSDSKNDNSTYTESKNKELLPIDEITHTDMSERNKTEQKELETDLKSEESTYFKKNVNNNEENDDEANTKTNSIWYIVAIIIFLVIVGGLIYYYYYKHNIVKVEIPEQIPILDTESQNTTLASRKTKRS
ncbi:hypothetical protein cand_032540 [Cryptosporidium andersoni]|uniref:Uncharacterized protein n=1 Tax=Cryptosporidium andersoni TaxID=117008 RepID=A0A1J4MFC1_9CRYT|nr:hypothetical protein cand_032540 [Cryptosporidium andersoni]